MTEHYPAWNRLPHSTQQSVIRVASPKDILFADIKDKVLPRGLGRSYGDCCLNDGATLLDMTPMNRFIAFDEDEGIITCDAGVSLADILGVCVNKGWFLPTTPGTRFVTVGGAIANDVHGKNHHTSGTFGCFVESFDLLRSDGIVYECTPTKNTELFQATIGGLGLTGVILKASLRLKKISSPDIQMESVKFNCLEDFFSIAESSNAQFEYTVAWIDALAKDQNLGRGLFMRGNHATTTASNMRHKDSPKTQLSVPFDFPNFCLNRYSIKAFNACYFHKQQAQVHAATVPYESFFYPLDKIAHWNRIYGKRGFYQYQCVVPPDNAPSVMRHIFATISNSRLASFLGVLKTFGDKTSPGLLSFPRLGTTLALDFPNTGAKLLELFKTLDAIVFKAGGALYPAKDARMTQESFRNSFPHWQEFLKYVDPKFSSGFYRRVVSP